MTSEKTLSLKRLLRKMVLMALLTLGAVLATHVVLVRNMMSIWGCVIVAAWWVGFELIVRMK